MTTPIDLGLIDKFSFILPVLLVYAGVLGLLTYKQTFNAVLNNLIAIIVALMMLFMPSILQVIQFAVPWMVVIGTFGAILILMAKFFGVDDEEIKAAWGKESIAYWFVTAIVIILIFSIGKVYFGEGGPLSEEERESAKSTGDLNFINTLLHPNMLGFLALMMIAIFTVALISAKGTRD